MSGLAHACKAALRSDIAHRRATMRICVLATCIKAASSMSRLAYTEGVLSGFAT